MTINTKGVAYMEKQRKQEISGKSTPDKASISEISRLLNNSLEDHDDKGTTIASAFRSMRIGRGLTQAKMAE